MGADVTHVACSVLAPSHCPRGVGLGAPECGEHECPWPCLPCFCFFPSALGLFGRVYFLQGQGFPEPSRGGLGTGRGIWWLLFWEPPAFRGEPPPWGRLGGEGALRVSSPSTASQVDADSDINIPPKGSAHQRPGGLSLRPQRWKGTCEAFQGGEEGGAPL